MPRYNIRCKFCGDVREIKVSFPEQDAGASITPPCEFIDCAGKTEVLIGSDHGVSWNTSGGTRGFGKSTHVPRLDPNRNIGHNPVTVGEMGLTREDCKELNIAYD